MKYPFVIALGFFVITSICQYGEQTCAAGASLQAEVVEVNDGDTVTIRMNGKAYRTRLIGIDAPETGQEPWGRRAKDHLSEIVKETGRTVEVETDVEKRDKYDRLLVYLHARDGSLINERMLRDGYAVLFTMPPNIRHVGRFRAAQRTAREKKLGIWGPDGLKELPLDYKKTHPRLESRP